MRSTVDIDEKLYNEAVKLAKARTKKELINKALAALIRRERVKNLRKRLGQVDLELDLKTLRKMREEG